MQRCSWCLQEKLVLAIEGPIHKVCDKCINDALNQKHIRRIKEEKCEVQPSTENVFRPYFSQAPKQSSRDEPPKRKRISKPRPPSSYHASKKDDDKDIGKVKFD